jgi:truncated hemoglobin YjbI
MGLCASKPQAAAGAADVAAPAAPTPAVPARTASATAAAAAEDAAAAAEEAHDTVGTQLTGAPSAGGVDAASGPSALLRKEQSVVGALPVFTKTPSKGRAVAGVPISDLPPPAAANHNNSSSPAPFATPPPAAAAAADGESSLGRRSKGYDSLERPSRSALRNASADGGGDAGPTPPSRKSLDSSVKFAGIPPPTPTAAAAAAAGAASPIDAEAADPETSQRRARLDAQSKTFSMRAVVDRFYERVWADPLLRPFFERVDKEKLKRHQEAAFALAFGGKELLVTLEGSAGGAPPSDLRAIHRRSMLEHGLGLEHFDAFLRHFKETVDAIPAIPQEQRETAIKQLQGTRALFEPLTDEEREQVLQQQKEQQRPSSGGGGGGRRKFLLFGPRVGSAGGSGGGGSGSGGGAAVVAAAAEKAAAEKAAAEAAP